MMKNLIAITILLMLGFGVSKTMSSMFSDSSEPAYEPEVKWEYTIELSRGPTDDSKMLNQFGSEGWELITVRSLKNSGRYFYFKRSLN